jgi:hypothetical protein
LLSDVQINIFNISKRDTGVRGGKSWRTQWSPASPRIKRLSEYLSE